MQKIIVVVRKILKGKGKELTNGNTKLWEKKEF